MIAVERLTSAIPGASDQDRDAWLAERRTGITATEIRDLYLGKITIEKLVALKLGREKDNFAGNEYTRWGVAREPVIAAAARERYAIEPESRVFHAADEPRFLASPDGLGQDFDGNTVASEYKTAEKDIAPGTEAYDAKGYFIQMVWAMRVLRARRCVYGAEYRIRVAGGFAPGELRFWTIEWDEEAARLAFKLEALANKFLAALDAAAAEEYVAPDFDDDLDTRAVNYLRFIGEEKSAAEAKKREFEAIKKALADRPRFSQKSALASITWTRGGQSTEVEQVEHLVVDLEAAKASRADLVAKLHAAEKRAESAALKAVAAREEWAAVLAEFTTTEVKDEQVSKSVRENLTITAPKIQETK